MQQCEGKKKRYLSEEKILKAAYQKGKTLEFN